MSHPWSERDEVGESLPGRSPGWSLRSAGNRRLVGELRPNDVLMQRVLAGLQAQLAAECHERGADCPGEWHVVNDLHGLG